MVNLGIWWSPEVITEWMYGTNAPKAVRQGVSIYGIWMHDSGRDMDISTYQRSYIMSQAQDWKE